VGRADEYEPGKFQIFTLDGRSVGVVRRDDEFFAVLNICPHELAPVCEGTFSGTMLPSAPGAAAYGLENRILRCPWHGYEFDLGNGGRAVFTTFRGRVRLLDVEVEGGEVFVELRRRS
jgi:nitrite reductase (NADH) small subunit